MGSFHFTPQQLANFRDAYLSAQNASFISMALFAVMIYEYLITFEEERKNFWKGPFSVSHGLFFFNRYFSIFIVSLSLLLYTTPNPTNELYKYDQRFILWKCDWAGSDSRQVSPQVSPHLHEHSNSKTNTLFTTAILITRVWFLFPGNRTVYFGLIFSFTLTFLLTIGFMSASLSHLKILPPKLFHIKGHVSQAGCHAKRPPFFWAVYLPSLALHTGLYVLTLYQSMYGAECSKKRDLRRILIVDGSLFYLIVLASVALVTLGSFLDSARTLNLAAIYTPIVICATSIATSRIMFGLRAYFLEVENNLGWEVTTELTTRHSPKGSLTDSFRSTIVLPHLPRVYKISFGTHHHVPHDPVEEEKDRAFDMKMALIFNDGYGLDEAETGRYR